MFICIVTFFHSLMLFHCIPSSLYHFRSHFPPIGPPFLSILPAFPVFHLFYFDFSISLSLSPLTVPSFSVSFTSLTNGHSFPISILCTHIPPFPFVQPKLCRDSHSCCVPYLFTQMMKAAASYRPSLHF